MVYFWVGIMIYLIFASIFITVRSIQIETADHKFAITDLFKNQLFFTLIVSLASTYILWFVISFLFFDPWHLFTSVSRSPSAFGQRLSLTRPQFLQYLLLTPTYINILNVYAFCNTHDITWGTKGDDKPPELEAAQAKPGGKVDVSIPQDDGDLNAQYDAEMKKIEQKAPKEVKVIKETEKQEDYYKGFRSAVVLAWMFCNLILTATVLSTAGLDRVELNLSDTQRATIYMAVVLWSVAALSLFRFCGAVWFLIVRLVSLIPSTHEPISAQRAFILRGFANACAFQLNSFAAFEQVWIILVGNILRVERYDKFDMQNILYGVWHMPAGASFLLVLSRDPFFYSYLPTLGFSRGVNHPGSSGISKVLPFLLEYVINPRHQVQSSVVFKTPRVFPCFANNMYSVELRIKTEMILS